jgi:rhamnose utilization protein RhaD (predicted bifunctional aldolase and dehydrogenase)
MRYQTLCRGTGETSIRAVNQTLVGEDVEVVWIHAVVETSIRGDINQT